MVCIGGSELLVVGEISDFSIRIPNDVVYLGWAFEVKHGELAGLASSRKRKRQAGANCSSMQMAARRKAGYRRVCSAGPQLGLKK